jgi:GT2 family glycosyltransferase
MVNYNGGERVLKALAALHAQDTPLDAVVVVDNGSDDGSRQQIQRTFPAVQVVEMGDNHGLPAGRNAGLKRVTNDVVLLIDADVYLERDTIRTMLRAMQETDAAVVCPRIRLIPDRDVVQADGADPHFLGTLALRHAYTPVASVASGLAEVGGCLGACMLVQRRSVEAVGRFDESYVFHFEDLEFCLRLRALGHHIVCQPSAVVYHDWRVGSPGLTFRGRGIYPKTRFYFTVRNRLLTVLATYRVRTLVVLFPALAAYEGASVLVALRRGFGAEWAGAWAWILRHTGAIRDRRRRIQRTRKVADRNLLVGGPVPLAPGFIQSRLAGMAVGWLSATLNLYWLIARRVIG